MDRNAGSVYGPPTAASFCSLDAHAITRAPRAASIWIAAMPIPPDPPNSSKVQFRRINRHFFRKRAHDDRRHHAIAWRDRCHVGADFLHHTGQLAARRERLRRLDLILIREMISSLVTLRRVTPRLAASAAAISSTIGSGMRVRLPAS